MVEKGARGAGVLVWVLRVIGVVRDTSWKRRVDSTLGEGVEVPVGADAEFDNAAVTVEEKD